MASPQRVVLISGPPGSGKTTLARPLAQRLDFALLSKDDIKESLYTSLGARPGDLEASRIIGAAAMDLLWALARHTPSVVIEANFRTRSPQEQAKFAAFDARLVEVYCRLPLEEASQRFAERAREVRHHPAHPLAEMPPDRMADYDGPFAMSPVIEVDTTQPVNIEALAAQVTEALQSATPPSPDSAGHLE